MWSSLTQPVVRGRSAARSVSATVNDPALAAQTLSVRALRGFLDRSRQPGGISGQIDNAQRQLAWTVFLAICAASGAVGLWALMQAVAVSGGNGLLESAARSPGLRAMSIGVVALFVVGFLRRLAQEPRRRVTAAATRAALSRAAAGAAGWALGWAGLGLLFLVASSATLQGVVHGTASSSEDLLVSCPVNAFCRKDCLSSSRATIFCW
jgi:hypothetical protein